GEGVGGVDAVFHTAAYFREYYGPGDHAAIVDRINVDATLELARAAHARGVKKMVDTSSAGIIGLGSGGAPGDETTPPWPRAARNLYFRSKMKAEPRLRELARETGFFIASVLPTWVWGPHDAGPTPSGQRGFRALAHNLAPP